MNTEQEKLKELAREVKYHRMNTLRKHKMEQLMGIKCDSSTKRVSYSSVKNVNNQYKFNKKSLMMYRNHWGYI